MSPAVLYVYHHSPAANAVLLAIRSLGLKDIEIKNVDISKGENRTPEYLAMNPQHTVPTLNDNGHILWESRAILTYLVESRVPGHRLYPSNPKVKSVINQRLYFDACTILPAWYEAFMPIFLNKATEVTKEAQDKVHEMFGVLERFLETSKWVAGNDVTVADMAILVSILGLVEIGVKMDKYPNIARWLDQCKKLPGYEEYAPGIVAWSHDVKPMMTKGFE